MQKNLFWSVKRHSRKTERIRNTHGRNKKGESCPELPPHFENVSIAASVHKFIFLSLDFFLPIIYLFVLVSKM